jgi:hypothetical protein
MKDIFVDTCLAGHFANPVLEEYKDFIRWLWTDGSLVVTHQLLTEYIGSTGSSRSRTCLHVIVDHQTRKGRLNKIGKAQLDAFSLPVHKKYLCNWKDRSHIKAVLLSFRRMGLTNDNAFRSDLESFQGEVLVGGTPSAVNYR